MVKQISTYFSETDELLLNIGESYKNDQKIAILGGHFLIDYSAENKTLKPLIVEDIADDEFKAVAQLEAGDFPFCSFKFALSLFKNFSKSFIDSKIVLLVNDHKTPYLSANHKKQLLPDLRKEYYQKNQIPESYLKLLSDHYLSEKEVLLPNSEIGSTVNTSNFLFSENHFRKRFDKFLKGKVLKSDGFYSKIGVSGKRDVFIEGLMGEDYCLSIDGACGCSGEVMQLIYTMVQKERYHNLIMFIPYECAIGVNNGIYAMLHYFSMLNINVNVKMITCLPCDNYFKYDPNSKTILTEFFN